MRVKLATRGRTNLSRSPSTKLVFYTNSNDNPNNQTHTPMTTLNDYTRTLHSTERSTPTRASISTVSLAWAVASDSPTSRFDGLGLSFKVSRTRKLSIWAFAPLPSRLFPETVRSVTRTGGKGLIFLSVTIHARARQGPCRAAHSGTVPFFHRRRIALT